MASLDPPEDSREKLKRLVNNPWALLVLVLHVGLLGIPLYWKTKYSLTVRLLIILASIVYTLVAVWLIVWWIGWMGRMLFG